MRVKAHKLKDGRFNNWHAEVENRWDYDDFLAHEHWRTDWISFDCCYYFPEQKRLYFGLTSFDADIFWYFDCLNKKFRSCGYEKIRNPFDAKFHRSLVRWQKDNCLYAAVALLHDIDRYWEAPGGAIVKYDPKTERLEKIAIPLPHTYIQAISLDQKQGIIYGITFTPERMFSFDITTRCSTDLGPIGSGGAMAQGENIELDDDGCAWSGWNLTRAWQSSPGPDSNRLCKYEPKGAKINYLKNGLPNPDKSYGYTKVEGIFNLGTGCLYASGGNGSLYRVEPQTTRITYLGTPVIDRRSRLSSLRLGPDGAAYGVVGRDGNCQVLRFDPKTEKYQVLGTISDGENNCWQIHDVAVTEDGTIYACENDNPGRSGYLWEITL